MDTLKDAAFWILAASHFGVIAVAFAIEWRKSSAITDELARRAGVGP